ncbi:asparagine synthetase B [Flavobacterium sp. PL002]|uniref:asparagine synthetase B family protein n=1 Tax=Flavobacterium sp. PL002 TaxID=1897058 RepID=UPI0017883360|nr:asparagine synthase-related protein [Flavobacterium sp. PL002]MBE0392887.1 Asparagine synthetase B [Flavobacterium sp. PL002]
MCGIVAIIGHHTETDCSNALSRIKHRGLDNTKIYNSENISIGFNRLAINDKTNNGMQPFKYKNLIGAFNGEIFNSIELADKYGITVHSKSDIEIILPLFAAIGVDIIDVIDGFYSGIIYNNETSEIFTIRDYIGKKPLFYGKTTKIEFVSSELKSFNKIQSFEFIPKGFSEIINHKIISLKKHSFPVLERSVLKKTIDESVRKRIPLNREKFGVFLSGGLDSSIIASIVSKYSTNTIYYTLGNEGNEDIAFVKRLGKYLKIENQIKYISLPKEEEIGKLIEQVVYHTESYNPSIISNGLATYLLSKSAKNDELKVLISGEGADELFCGYKISENIIETREMSNILIENLHYTELRRLDLSSMANTIEIRCPFLDKKVYSISKKLPTADLKDKQILRNIFGSDLPKEIIERTKTSFDVGSGVRKLVVEYLTKDNKTERETLKEIWSKFFDLNISNNEYYHQYPVFDKSITKRSISHK